MTNPDDGAHERPADELAATADELADLVTEHVAEGLARSNSAAGLSPRELSVDVDGLVVTVSLGDEALLQHSFALESWETVDSHDPAFAPDDSDGSDRSRLDPEEAAVTLAERVLDEVDVETRLVERRRERLAAAVVEEATARIRSRLATAAPDVDWDLSVDVVALPHEYRHGDPEWVYETGYPPYGLEVVSFDPDAAVVVEVEDEPPVGEPIDETASGVESEETVGVDGASPVDVEPLVEAAVDRLLEAVGDG